MEPQVVLPSDITQHSETSNTVTPVWPLSLPCHAAYGAREVNHRKPIMDIEHLGETLPYQCPLSTPSP